MCEDLGKGSPAAMFLYGLERCDYPNTDTPQWRSMDEAFRNSAAFAENSVAYTEKYLPSLTNDARLLKVVVGQDVDGRPCTPEAIARAVQAKALAMTALFLACEEGFPPALCFYPEDVPIFKVLQVWRGDHKIPMYQHYLLKGMEQGGAHTAEAVWTEAVKQIDKLTDNGYILSIPTGRFDFMTVITIDTLAISKKFVALGFTSEQAEGFANLLKQKDDADKKAFEAFKENVQVKIDAKDEALRKELATKADLAVAQANLELKIEQTRSSLLRWQLGIGAAILTLMGSGFGAIIYILAKVLGWAGF